MTHKTENLLINNVDCEIDADWIYKSDRLLTHEVSLHIRIDEHWEERSMMVSTVEAELLSVSSPFSPVWTLFLRGWVGDGEYAHLQIIDQSTDGENK